MYFSFHVAYCLLGKIFNLVIIKPNFLFVKLNLISLKWALAADKDSVDDTVCKMYGISKEKWTQFCQSHRDPSWEVTNLEFSFF